jgi:hypothetical protein
MSEAKERSHTINENETSFNYEYLQMEKHNVRLICGCSLSVHCLIFDRDCFELGRLVSSLYQFWHPLKICQIDLN